MKKINELLKDASFIGLELCYLVWGAFLAVFLPVLNYLGPNVVAIFGIKIPFSIYVVIVGLLYLFSAVFLVRRRPFGLKLAIAANVLGIPLLVPIVLGLISFVLLNRPEIKEQFKK
ncbi:MAG: hypothetical protein KJ593_06990 [Candidatus Omnitrophica bacterium]|nr:hypothetical protein [Candidatus Omnitrophota bacterium]